MTLPQMKKILELMRANNVLAFEVENFKVTFEDPRVSLAKSPLGLAPAPAIPEIAGLSLKNSTAINLHEPEPSDEELLFASANDPGHIREGKK